ncbi:hypothetical protein RND71_036833 [Anisodus tanguticus]|uniref:Uncharacterized protein n=1 Tax=Anisodus tanguticus TaxID=243964 RepID=A0AAE1R175_9SOLA|nr:hypothetical protein RND71_036833 [Anisodus tanguticus]
MVPVTPYEDDLTDETMVNVSNVKGTSGSSKKQRVAETSDLWRGQSMQVQREERLQDVEIEDEVRCTTANTENNDDVDDDELHFDSDED